MKLIQSVKMVCAAAALVAISGIAHAVNFAASRTTADVYSDGVARFLPLNNAGSTTLTFFVNSTVPRAVLFNAECSVASADSITWYDIDIQIIAPGGAVTTLAPSNDDNAFCTSSGLNALQRWSSNATNGTFTPAQVGNYQVRVRGTLQGFAAGESVRIDDTSLIILE